MLLTIIKNNNIKTIFNIAKKTLLLLLALRICSPVFMLEADAYGFDFARVLGEYYFASIGENEEIIDENI